MSNPQRFWQLAAVVTALVQTTPAHAARTLEAAKGKPIVLETEPSLPLRACSFRLPLCVHGADGAIVLAELGALERAWDTGIVLGVPLPRSHDAYLHAGPAGSAIAQLDSLSHFDRARSFSELDTRRDGCTRDFEAARELYAASAREVSPAVDEGSLRAESTALARLAVPCALIDASSFQAHADRALVDVHVDDDAYLDGASNFFSWLDASFGKSPGHLIAATWALAPTHTRGDDHWSGEPDTFAVLRESLKDAMFTGSTIDDAVHEHCIVRALTLEPAPHFDWDIAWPATARTLASPEGIAPTGCAFTHVDLRGRKPNARFRLDAAWEEHARMRWTIIKLDAHGHDIARIEATTQPKAVDAHTQVVDLDDASALLVVATNVGNWTTPFDPDDEIWEPHGWLLTIAAE